MLRLPAAAVVVLAVLALAGCTIPGTSPPPAASAPTTAPAPAAPSASPGPVESKSAQDAGIDLTNLPAPVASARTPARVSGDPNATMEVALHSLRRTGRTVTATFSFRVHASATGGGSATLLGFLGVPWAPFLVDPVNLRRHDVLTAAGQPALTASGTAGQRFRPGQTLYAYAMFAAPPVDVTAMDVQLLSGAPTAVGIPLR